MMIGNVVRTGQINRQKAFSTNKPEVVDFPTTVCTDCGAALSEGTEFCTPCEAARKIPIPIPESPGEVCGWGGKAGEAV